MLLRSSSTPILKTCIVQSSAAAAAAADSVHRIPSKPISLTASPINRIQRASSDGNMKQYAVRKKQKVPGSPMGSPKSVKEEDFNDDVRTLSLVGGGAGGEGGVEGFGDWDQGKQRMDEYYENMIRTYPGETLLLANYSKFLKEVRGDLVKAEEYCERAVQVNPDDGEILSMYGDLIWANHGDGARAQSYFDRAVEASPNDCNVLASYARYLWTSEEEDEEGNNQKKEHQMKAQPHAPFAAHGRPHLAAASY